MTNKRIKLACDDCRRKRKKCDDVEPECGLCLKHGNACKYSYGLDKRKPPSKSYVAALETKIQGLESKIQQYEARHEKQVAPTNGNLDIAPLEPMTGNSERIDPFHRLNISEDGRVRSYGPRSSISFIDQKLNLVHKPYCDNDQIRRQLVEKYYDVPDGLRDHILGLFWTFQNSTISFVWRDLFVKDLIVGKTGKYCSVTLLSAMLAVGSQFADDMSAGTTGTKCADLCNHLIFYERESPTITTIRACGILSMYYIFKDQEVLAWDYCGMAVRIAFALGLNMINETWINNGDIDNEEENLHRTVWWACYVLEKIICNIVGRPVTIKRYNITSMAPTEHSLEEFSGWKCPTHDHPLDGTYSRLFSTTTFMIELYMISADTLDQLHLAYHPSPGSLQETIVNGANLELIEFERSLPSFMRICRSKDKEPLLPHIYIFHLHCHYILTLIHRAIFIRQMRLPASLDQEDMYQTMCRTNANAITLLIVEYDKSYTLRTVDFTAAEILCCASIVRMYLAKAPDPRIKEPAIKRLITSVQMLKRISQNNWWAKRCEQVLRALAQQWHIDEEVVHYIF